MKSKQLLEQLSQYMTNTSLTNISIDPYNHNYEGFNACIGDCFFMSRLARKTPHKKGYFVVLWTKDASQTNRPYSYDEMPNHLIISIIDDQKRGLFVLSKQILKQNGILSSSNHPGKMGFRIYTPWDDSLNKTAIKSYRWQQDTFIDLSHDTISNVTKQFQTLLAHSKS